MNRSGVSIHDIAKVANVSHSTVSRALRNSPLISTATRERIQRLALEMDYIPNAVARSLQTRRTDTVGLVVTSIADPFFVDVVKGIEAAAHPAGLSIFLNASHNDPRQELSVVETFRRRKVDGILVASSHIGHRYVEQLERIGVPVVLINSEAKGAYEFLYSVAVDDGAGARLAVEHLLDLGHRCIGYVGVRNRPLSNQRRCDGYSESLKSAGVTPGAQWILQPESDAGQRSDVEIGRSAVPHLSEAGVTAVCCYNDMVAVGVLLGCRQYGIGVPHDLSVVGFDDVELAQYVTPALTTVHQPKQELGQAAMQMLLALLQGQPTNNTLLQPKLVVRGSTARIQAESAV